MNSPVRTTVCCLVTSILLTATSSLSMAATHGRDAEMQRARWQATSLGLPCSASGSTQPQASVQGFSFLYGEKKLTGLGDWPRNATSHAIDEERTEETVVGTDPQSGLQVTLKAILYKDFPAVEWTLHFKNTGSQDSPILEQILPLDQSLVSLDSASSGAASPPILHCAKGAVCSLDDFSPCEEKLEPGVHVDLQPGGGRSSSEYLPFFNLDQGTRGVVVGIGWSGQWQASFSRAQDGSLALKAGMADTRLVLHPGEEIRTPKMLMLFWEGDRMRGQNLLRRFILAHHRPKPSGEPLVLPVLITSWGADPAASHLKIIERIIRHNLPIGLYWIDAEWYANGPWFKNVGNWEVRADLYPQGFKALSDPLHQAGRKFLLWFESHRVCDGTPWSKFKERPGWLLDLNGGVPEYKQHDMNWGVPHEDPRWVLWEGRRSQIVPGDRLWNLGNPEAREFLTNWLSDRIDEFGLDWYREDANVAPLEYWQTNDAPDRRGMTEIRFVEGLYRMWDDLLARHPHLAIDNCASGGRRIDLETLHRATALWRTDWPADALHRQCHTFGLMHWVPLHMSDGPVLEKGCEYELRSAMTAGLNVKLSAKADEASDQEAKALIDQYLAIQRFFYGDFYPLTPYSQSQEAWLAYQLHLPESDEGLVVALRRPASAQDTQKLRLSGLDREASYDIVDLDSNRTTTIAGSVLADAGLDVAIANRPGSALLRFQRVKKP